MKEPTSRELAEKITAAIHEAVALRMPGGATLTQVHAHLIASNLMVSRDTVIFWLRSLHDTRKLACSTTHHWVLGPNAALLRWDKPPPELPYEQWAAYQADSTPPGTYAPNMDDAWKRHWKAKMHGQRSAGFDRLRVEIRKSVISGHHHAQVLIVVLYNGSVRTSQNGTAEWSALEIAELPLAIDEAREAMQLHVRHHPAEPVMETA